MAPHSDIPSDPLEFIVTCVREGRLYWTYHVNLRLDIRRIERRALIGAIQTYEIIEQYPNDKYLPSYLIRFVDTDTIYHALFATDVEGKNVRVVTIYRPDSEKWTPDKRQRKTS